MNFRTILTMACGLLITSVSWATTGSYDYPIDNAYAATVIGTPPEFEPELPKKIRSKEYKLAVIEDRDIPAPLWHGDRLRYTLAYQKEKAPLIFAIAGTGASNSSPKMKLLKRAFHQAGFHVISLSSPTHPNFVTAASHSGVPGHMVEDSKDLYQVMQLAWEQVKDRIEVSEFHLTGYSLGAANAAFIAKMDEEQKVFNFGKVLMINPPVSLYNSVARLDAMLEENIPGGLDNFDEFFNSVMERFSDHYAEGQYVEFNSEFLYTAYEKYQPETERIKALIGFAFRISAANMIVTSDMLTNSGYIAPKNHEFSVTESVTDLGKVAFRTSFLDYFDEYLFPYFKEQDPGLTREALLEELSLKSIEDYLARNDNIGLMHNADDVILEPGEIDYLRQVFGPRAKIYPSGGHCGNMDHRDNVAYMVQFFAN